MDEVVRCLLCSCACRWLWRWLRQDLGIQWQLGRRGSGGNAGGDRHSCAEETGFYGRVQAAGQPSFVGVYVAQEKGYFRDNALDVDIQHDQTGAQNLQLLLAGQVQVTTANGAQVIQRNAGDLPLSDLHS